MGGAIVESGRFDWGQNDKFPSMTKPDEAYHGLTFYETFGDFGFTMRVRAVALRDFGAALSPTNAFLTITGIETLPLRMERHVANAEAAAAFLEDHPAVAWVSYAGLESSPSFEMKNTYFPKGLRICFHLRRQGRFRCRQTARRKLQPSVASRQRRRHTKPYPASRLHHPSPAHGRTTGRRGRRSGSGEDFGRPRDGGRHSPGSRRSADAVDGTSWRVPGAVPCDSGPFLPVRRCIPCSSSANSATLSSSAFAGRDRSGNKGASRAVDAFLLETQERLVGANPRERDELAGEVTACAAANCSAGNQPD